MKAQHCETRASEAKQWRSNTQDANIVNTEPSQHLAILRGPGHGARQQHAALHLQRTIGNARTARILQRDYAVPPEKECSDVVPWLNANSPYAPEWAETRSTYTFVGQADFKTEGLPDGTFKAMIKGNSKLKVKVNSPVDRPTWNPSPRPNRAAVVKAWQNMRSVLDAHENEHRKIAEQERVKMESNWQSVDITMTGTTQEEAKNKAVAELQAQQERWRKAAQGEQDKIDPFRGAVLVCPAEGTQSESTESGSTDTQVAPDEL
jgi:hypothetical protein